MSASPRRHLALLLEAIHRFEADADRWLAGIVARANPILGRGLGVIGCEVSVGPDGRRVRPVAASGGGRGARIPRWLTATAEIPARDWEAIAVPTPPATTWRRIAAHLAGDGALAALRNGSDALAIRGTAPDGRNGVVLLAPSPGPVRLSGRRQRMLDRIGVQLAIAHRLRSTLAGRDPFALAATLLSPEPEPRGLQAVGRKETPEAAAEIWFALLAGQWCAVDHRDRDGKRLLLTITTPSAGAAAIELSPDEREVLLRTAARQPLKRVAGELDLGVSTASALLRSALRKLRLDSPSAAIRIFSAGK